MNPLKNVTRRAKMAVKYFVGEAGFNKTKAMIMAGYSVKCAEKNCGDFFKDPLISKLLDEEMKGMIDSSHLTAEFLIHSMLKIVGYGIKPRHIKKTKILKNGTVETTEWDEDIQDAKAAIEASKLLSQCLPDFKQRSEVTVDVKPEEPDDELEFSDGTVISFVNKPEDKEEDKKPE